MEIQNKSDEINRVDKDYATGMLIMLFCVVCCGMVSVFISVFS